MDKFPQNCALAKSNSTFGKREGDEEGGVLMREGDHEGGVLMAKYAFSTSGKVESHS